MAEIRAFRGIRYREDKAGDIAGLVAPPYDVVGEDERDRIVSCNPRNIFALELPKGGPCGLPEQERYTCAERLFKDWLRQGVLALEDTPSVYPYEITFSHRGRRLTRTGFVALVRIEHWEAKVILPHEKTFDKVTEDRLLLTRATRARFSQVFALYRPNPRARAVLSGVRKEVLATVEDSLGNVHVFSKATDPEAIRELAEAISASPLYIADGHHRYTTALRYRDEMRARNGNPNAPYNYLMTYLVDAGDPGLVVLPTHRVVTFPEAPDPVGCAEKAAGAVERDPVEPGRSPSETAHRVSTLLAARPERRGVGLVWDGRAEIWWETGQGLSGISKVLSRLDVLFLNDVVLKGVFGITPEANGQGAAIAYTPDAASAATNLAGNQILFILRGTPTEDVLDIADAGLTMPHKSTFFAPKILTGFVLHSLDPENRAME
ncbi:MAG: DUF1015 domain-containing protein [Deltaproteobacteria bacterium]